MNSASFSDRRLSEAEPKAGIVRLIRRVCVLREQGDLSAAEQVRNDLERAVADYRGERGADALTDGDVQALFTAEEQRVADAAALCELLLPRLLRALPGVSPAVQTESVRPPSAPRHGTAIPAAPPAITDLLDAMLASERPGRPSAAAPREP